MIRAGNDKQILAHGLADVLGLFGTTALGESSVAAHSCSPQCVSIRFSSYRSLLGKLCITARAKTATVSGLENGLGRFFQWIL